MTPLPSNRPVIKNTPPLSLPKQNKAKGCLPMSLFNSSKLGAGVSGQSVSLSAKSQKTTKSIRLDPNLTNKRKTILLAHPVKVVISTTTAGGEGGEGGEGQGGSDIQPAPDTENITIYCQTEKEACSVRESLEDPLSNSQSLGGLSPLTTPNIPRDELSAQTLNVDEQNATQEQLKFTLRWHSTLARDTMRKVCTKLHDKLQITNIIATEVFCSESNKWVISFCFVSFYNKKKSINDIIKSSLGDFKPLHSTSFAMELDHFVHKTLHSNYEKGVVIALPKFLHSKQTADMQNIAKHSFVYDTPEARFEEIAFDYEATMGKTPENDPSSKVKFEELYKKFGQPLLLLKALIGEAKDLSIGFFTEKSNSKRSFTDKSADELFSFLQALINNQITNLSKRIRKQKGKLLDQKNRKSRLNDLNLLVISLDMVCFLAPYVYIQEDEAKNNPEKRRFLDLEISDTCEIIQRWKRELKHLANLSLADHCGIVLDLFADCETDYRNKYKEEKQKPKKLTAFFRMLRDCEFAEVTGAKLSIKGIEIIRKKLSTGSEEFDQIGLDRSKKYFSR